MADVSEPAHQLLLLPPEILIHICSFFGAEDLVALSKTCQQLRLCAERDQLWRTVVNEHLPGNEVESPAPGKTFRELFGLFYPYWLLTKHKIWFSDDPFTGNFIFARFDQRRGVIEALRVMAQKQLSGHSVWGYIPHFYIPTFNPLVHLHLDDPVIYLGPVRGPFGQREELQKNNCRYLKDDRFYDLPGSDDQRAHVSSGLILIRPLLHTDAETPKRSSNQGSLWPPITIPTQDRTLGGPPDNPVTETTPYPMYEPHMSDQLFKLRRWVSWSRNRHDGPRLGERVHTYSTISPELYKPTSDKPWRGIWVGDYGGHGCEFLLMHQPDERHLEHDRRLGLQYRTGSHPLTTESLVAIKLTGDVNVERGEPSFIAHDVGPEGLIRVAEDELFNGSRVVKSEGQVAWENGRDAKFIESELFLISHDRLAMHWKELRQVCYYCRVDLEALQADEGER